MSERQAKLVLGVVWSSVGRYCLFMTSGTWGGWFDQVTAEDLLATPIRLSDTGVEAGVNSAVTRVVAAVDDIRFWSPHHSMFGDEEPPSDDMPPPMPVLAQLDQAVFDLFELAEPERDLVRDFHAYALNLLSRGPESDALAPLSGLSPIIQGVFTDLDGSAALPPEMARYVRVFLE